MCCCLCIDGIAFAVIIHVVVVCGSRSRLRAIVFTVIVACFLLLLRRLKRRTGRTSRPRSTSAGSWKTFTYVAISHDEHTDTDHDYKNLGKFYSNVRSWFRIAYEEPVER